MKLAVSIVILASLAIAVAIARPWRSRGGEAAQAGPAATRPAQSSLGVDDLMRNVDRHRGAVTVVGVVSAASADNQAVALIDTEEFRRCKETGCAELVLPVRWAGTMPKVEDLVLVEGEVKDDAGKLVFVASKLSFADQGK